MGPTEEAHQGLAHGYDHCPELVTTAATHLVRVDAIETLAGARDDARSWLIGIDQIQIIAGAGKAVGAAFTVVEPKAASDVVHGRRNW